MIHSCSLAGSKQKVACSTLGHCKIKKSLLVKFYLYSCMEKKIVISLTESEWNVAIISISRVEMKFVSCSLLLVALNYLKYINLVIVTYKIVVG